MLIPFETISFLICTVRKQKRARIEIHKIDLVCKTLKNNLNSLIRDVSNIFLGYAQTFIWSKYFGSDLKRLNTTLYICNHKNISNAFTYTYSSSITTLSLTKQVNSNLENQI